jgi:small GTP-binding protein
MGNNHVSEQTPPGFKLLHTLRGHNAEINKIAWSCNGRMLASSAQDGLIQIWDTVKGSLRYTLNVYPNKVYAVDYSPKQSILAAGTSDNKVLLLDPETGKLIHELKHHSGNVYAVAWAPEGEFLASGAKDGNIILWQVDKQKVFKKHIGHSQQVNALSWSPDGKRLASSSDDDSIHIWDSQTGETLRIINRAGGFVSCLVWSPKQQILASSGNDRTIRLWDTTTGNLIKILEAHNEWVSSLSFSADGSILASKSLDGTVRLWRCDSWETISILEESTSDATFAGLAFNPKYSYLATLGEDGKAIRIWELDFTLLLNSLPAVTSSHYKNAKIVLLGDSGVGKTGLSLVLTGKPWVETESTHGRYVWTLEKHEVKLDDGLTETHEILLWDLAGQPDYRLIHQLHLAEVSVALLVFDAKSQIDPFSGVRYWLKALRQAELIKENSESLVSKLLVAARSDVGRVGVSRTRIKALEEDLELSGYFETSAKEGWGINELGHAIRNCIKWETLPTVSSTELFKQIKDFLVTEKASGRLLSTSNDLCRDYIKETEGSYEEVDLHAEFGTCIKQLESGGLIRQLSFGDLILLQPELLDAYASAIVSAAKDEPDGLGCISEQKARIGEFRIPKSERVGSREQEKLLLIATIEELLRHEIALREQGLDDQYLVFPSQLTREHPMSPGLQVGAVIFTFEGPIINIYATLAVRLSHSGIFCKKEMWKNAANYAAKVGGDCGISLREIEEGHGELTLSFSEETSEETCFHFEEFIYGHLSRRAIHGSVQRRRVFICHSCQTPISELAVNRRRERGFSWISCNVCEQQISILDLKERLPAAVSKIKEMDRVADVRRKRETATTIIVGKMATKDFDVFLCHNNADKLEVIEIGMQLKAQGILPWLDEWELPPGRPWQKLLEKQIAKIKSAAVFIGSEGIGPWQEQELEAFLREFVRRDVPVIPVILPTAPTTPALPVFLSGMTWVDFRKQDSKQLERLIWGITGERRPS